jgi:hypothetical protein
MLKMCRCVNVDKKAKEKLFFCLTERQAIKICVAVEV